MWRDRLKNLMRRISIMKWVTPKGVKLDRSACVWLIKNHIDPKAEIGYLNINEIPAAVEDGAKAFHNTVSENGASRERTSFQELLSTNGLNSDPVLSLLGDIVRGAETKEAGSIEEAEGLRAVAKGTNALVGSDEEMVERMSPVFDALYAYCKRRVEGHRDWASSERIAATA